MAKEKVTSKRIKVAEEIEETIRTFESAYGFLDNSLKLKLSDCEETKELLDDLRKCVRATYKALKYLGAGDLKRTVGTANNFEGYLINKEGEGYDNDDYPYYYIY